MHNHILHTDRRMDRDNCVIANLSTIWQLNLFSLLLDVNENPLEFSLHLFRAYPHCLKHVYIYIFACNIIITREVCRNPLTYHYIGMTGSAKMIATNDVYQDH